MTFSAFLRPSLYFGIQSTQRFYTPPKTKELIITDVKFIYCNDITEIIIISASNSGNINIQICQIKVNGKPVSFWEATNSVTLTVGATETFTITQAITSGNKYSINIFEKDGTLIGSFTKTA